LRARRLSPANDRRKAGSALRRARQRTGVPRMLKFLSSAVGIIFIIGLLVVIGLFALIF